MRRSQFLAGWETPGFRQDAPLWTRRRRLPSPAAFAKQQLANEHGCVTPGAGRFQAVMEIAEEYEERSRR